MLYNKFYVIVGNFIKKNNNFYSPLTVPLHPRKISTLMDYYSLFQTS